MIKNFLKKFNVIDYILICILLLSLIGIIVKIAVGSGSGESARYAVTYVCESAPPEVLERMPQTGTCTDADSGISLGQLRHLEKDDTSQGLRFSSEFKGSASEHGILTGGKQYVIGQRLTVNVGNVQLSVYISDISKL